MNETSRRHAHNADAQNRYQNFCKPALVPLALPVFLIAREGLAAAVLAPFVCVVTLILAANLVDLLPNDTLIPFTWLIAGAILGHAESLAAMRRAARAETFNARFKPGRTVL